jgi:hypothetical protein
MTWVIISLALLLYGEEAHAGIWCNKCTGRLSSSVALRRGGSLWTNKFGVTNARVTSLAQWLYGKEAHTGQTNDSLPPPDKLQHKKWISSQGQGYFAILATYSPPRKDTFTAKCSFVDILAGGTSSRFNLYMINNYK